MGQITLCQGRQAKEGMADNGTLQPGAEEGCLSHVYIPSIPLGMVDSVEGISRRLWGIEQGVGT